MAAFGAKVFGRVGDANISLLDVRTRDAGGTPGRNFAAGRIYQNILAESKIGMIFTSGSSDGARNILAGFDWTYDFTNFAVQFSSALRRPWLLSAEWRFGPFYSGWYDNAELAFTYKFRGYATISLNADLVRGRLPQGRFNENAYQLKADFFVSPDPGLMNYIQYDDGSRKLGWNLRLHWQIFPGNEIYFVYGKN